MSIDTTNITSISFGRGIYGEHLEEGRHFDRISHKSYERRYPINGGKIGKYPWERKHGWHNAPRDTYHSPDHHDRKPGLNY